MDFFPNKSYPEQIPLDMVKHLTKYTNDKVVCDVGGGSGNLLEYIKQKKYAKSVLGIEMEKNRTSIKERVYIQLEDIFI